MRLSLVEARVYIGCIESIAASTVASDMATMKAARFHGAGDIRIEDIPIPILKPDHVLVDVEWCGLCGSDLHEYEMGMHDSC